MLGLPYMPAITFIVQRLALGVLAAMTFLRLVTEETYFATENSFIIPQERKEEVARSLADPDTIFIFENLDILQPLKALPINPKQSSQDSPDPQLEDELTEVLNSNLPEETEDIFVLPADILRKEAQTQGVTIPKQLTAKPTPQETHRKQQEILLQETLATIEARLAEIKIQQEQIQSPTLVTQQEEVSNSPSVQTVTIPNTLANAVINIVCLEKNGNTLSIAVGSGVIISATGTIITNGHVAQHILKQESELVDCEVKHPQHPTMRYRVAVVHIPDMWRGGGLLNESRGTGENDFAFLKVVGPAPNGILPRSFPFINLQTSERALTIGNAILLSGYPAQQTGNIERDTNAPQVRGESSIQNVFTFSDDSIDIISSGVSPVARQGSSGGAVVDNESLIGIIVTTNTTESGEMYLNGLTLNYIQRELRNQGLSLDSFI